MHIFTYGTLVFPEVWRTVAGRAYATVGGRASGFAIYRVREAAFPGIIAAGAEDFVPGVVYLDVDSDDLERLDQFEDDFYVRRSLAIDCDDGLSRQADAYVVPADNRHVLTDQVWLASEFVARGDLERFRNGFAGFRRVAADDR